jgi:cyclophilin family peptidyl-prolyl cis-trans isomerase
MQRPAYIILSCLAAIVMASFAGCGNKGETPQATASINGSDNSSVKPDEASSGVKTGKLGQPRPQPVVAFDTSLGTFTIQLDEEKADLTVKNFLSYVNDKFYDRTVIHQVFKGQCILGGAFSTDLVEKSAHPPVFNEAENGLKNLRGTISMVRQFDIIDSATSQFFLNVADNPVLDHKDRTPEGYGYCVFGKVISGMDVIDKIAILPVEDQPPKFERKPVQNVVINTVRRIQ